MKNGTKTIISSVYELNYEPERSGCVYKNFALLAETLNASIFPEYDYIIYTNEFTLNKHNLAQIYNAPNIKLIIKELDGDYYTNKINPIRIEKFQAAKGELFDRVYSVKNYIEVILNKIQSILDHSSIENEEDKDDLVIWLDAGLFGTSCDNAWRDYMRKIIYHNKGFLDKIFEKAEQNDFVATRGNSIVLNYELKDRVRDLTGVYLDKLVPGCLFGGKKYKNLEVLKEYKNVFDKHLETYKEVISEQEVMTVLMHDKDIKYFEFGDWIDLQKAFLQIMDLYRENEYQINKCYDA
jgi:hypothetical protein